MKRLLYHFCRRKQPTFLTPRPPKSAPDNSFLQFSVQPLRHRSVYWTTLIVYRMKPRMIPLLTQRVINLLKMRRMEELK